MAEKVPVIQKNKHGTYHLSDNKHLYEVARSNNFEFVVTGLEDLKIKTSEVLATEVPNAQEDLRLSVTRSSVPHFTQAVVEVRRGNSVMKMAGLPTFESGSLEVNDFVGINTKQKLIAWQSLSYNVHTETIGKMVEYKKDCVLIEYTPDYEMIRSWDLIGCWISALSEEDYSMDSGDKRTIKATIQYDRAIPHTEPDTVDEEDEG